MITGAGCVTPCGIGAEQLWSSIVAGRSGIKPISSFDATGCGSQVAGEILDFQAADFLARREIQAFSRYVHFGVAAARMAWEDAGTPVRRVDSDRVGVFVGSSVAATGRIVADAGVFFEKGLERVHPMFPIQYPGSLPSEISIALGLRGPTYTHLDGVHGGCGRRGSRALADRNRSARRRARRRQ